MDVKGHVLPSESIIFGVTLPEPTSGKYKTALMGCKSDGVFDFIHDTNDDRPCMAVCDKV